MAQVRLFEPGSWLSSLTFPREVAARRMGCKRSATLIYLGLALFRSDQMITEKEIRTGTGPVGTAFAHSSTTATPPPTIAPLTSRPRLATDPC